MKFNSPIDTQAFGLLLEYVDTLSQSTANTNPPPDLKELLRFLWLINAHPELIALGFVSEHIVKSLSILNRIGALTPTFEYLKEWPRISKWISSNIDYLAEDVAPEIALRPISSDDHLLNHKGLGRHCLYAVLCNDHKIPELREKFSFLVGFYLLGYSKTIKDLTSEHTYCSYAGKNHLPLLNSPYNASLALRDFSTDSGSFVTNIRIKASVNELIDYCAVYCKENPTAPLEKKIKYYASFIAKSFGIRDWVNRSNSSTAGGGGAGSRARIPGYLIVDPFSSDDDDHKTKLTSLQKSFRSHRKCLKLDLHPDESTENKTLLLVGVDCSNAKKGSGKSAFAALGYARHTAMRNQLLPWTQNQLSITKLSKLLKFCRDAFEPLTRKDEWSEDDFKEAELISLIHIILWTGAPLSSAKKIQMTNNVSSSKEFVLFSNDQSEFVPEWRIKAYQPDYASYLEEDSQFTCQREEYVFLPDIRQGSFFLTHTNSKKPGPLFKGSSEKYKSYLKAYLKKIDPTIKISHLEKFLFQAILHYTNDISLATEITAYPHPLSRVKVFYSTIATSTIRDTYVEVTKDIATKVYTALGGKFTPKTHETKTKMTYVGSRMRAKNHAVKEAVEGIRAKLETLTESITTNRSQFIEYHNHYTLYTILFFAYATACRAIVSPYIPLKHIDQERGLTALADKDGEDGNKGRLVWIPDSLLSQIKIYEEHCATTLVYWPNLLKPSQTRQDCFFINDRQHCETVIPTSIKKYLERFLPLPINCNRRFMRMQLVERNCPTEIIDAFMGHWYYGEEPWGQFSSLSFSDYLTEIKQHLLPILEGQLGFKPIKTCLLKSI